MENNQIIKQPSEDKKVALPKVKKQRKKKLTKENDEFLKSLIKK